MQPMIRTIPETGSTNADLLTEAKDGAPEGTWLRAERQNSGRGRMARAWSSPPGNLYASTIIRLTPSDPPPPSLALLAGVALYETAVAYAGAARSGSLRLKWPNDLLAGPNKLAGILLERSGNAVVAGFGINLAEAPSLPDRAVASFASIGAAVPDPALFLEDLAVNVARWLRVWRGQGLVPLRAAWLAAAHPIGTALAAGSPGERIEGLFAGLDGDGNLLIDRSDGTITTIHAGDVFLI